MIEEVRKRQENEPDADTENSSENEESVKLKWQYFDETAYIDKTRLQPGQDAYIRNKFNQAASDRMKSNRDIPDTRNAK